MYFSVSNYKVTKLNTVACHPLQLTSRLRMQPSFPEGGNGDVTSEDRRIGISLRETNPLRV